MCCTPKYTFRSIAWSWHKKATPLYSRKKDRILTEVGSLSCRTNTANHALSVNRSSDKNWMTTISFPSTFDRIESCRFAHKNAGLRIDCNRGGRHGVDHAHDVLHDDRRRGGVCAVSFQKGLLKSPYWFSPFFLTHGSKWITTNVSENGA
jgi:hypothetical protein